MVLDANRNVTPIGKPASFCLVRSFLLSCWNSSNDSWNLFGVMFWPLNNGLLLIVGERSFKVSGTLWEELSQYGRFSIAIHGILDLKPVRRTTRVLFPLKKLRKFLTLTAAILENKITHNSSYLQSRAAEK